ncbi:hypothetical protein O3P69_014664 [Scylla paramamosain]|uniref:Uncharacterized protein n=1 Tax=Scylla paramamosain TaxID=85552 RepID=A0AAW0TXF1_SCYPA
MIQSRAQEERYTIFIGGDETAPITDVGNPVADGRPLTSEDDPTPEVNNKKKKVAAIVNAYVIYKEANAESAPVLGFRRELAQGLLTLGKSNTSPRASKQRKIAYFIPAFVRFNNTCVHWPHFIEKKGSATGPCASDSGEEAVEEAQQEDPTCPSIPCTLIAAERGYFYTDV